MITDRAPPATQPALSLEGINAASLQQLVGIDSSSLQKILLAIADAQKTLRSERSREAVANARKRGQKLGRPRAMNEAQIALAHRMLANGATRKTIARTLKVSISTLYATLKPYTAEAPNPHGRPRTLTGPEIAANPYAVEARIPKKTAGRPRALTATQIALARRMLAVGATRKSIAQVLKVSTTTLYLALKPYGMGPFPQMGRSRKKTPATGRDRGTQPNAPQTMERRE
jgi:DNA invertase Pin-like site-specific DNA recombinase